MKRVDGPVIGLSWPRPDYLKALEHAGATPRVLKPEHDPLPDALAECDGILLTGGADVDPAHYTTEPRHQTVKPDAARDEYEFAIARYVLEHDVPVLAICRGAQLLNVAAGGTLVQDIPSSMPSRVVHRRPTAPRVKSTRAHDISVREGTCLATLLAGAARTADGGVAVNSRHHQAMETVATGFVVSATAPDGIVEAIEKPNAAFCVGVQWHPENYWRTGEFASLFRGLVDAAAAGPAAPAAAG